MHPLLRPLVRREQEHGGSGLVERAVNGVSLGDPGAWGRVEPGFQRALLTRISPRKISILQLEEVKVINDQCDILKQQNPEKMKDNVYFQK